MLTTFFAAAAINYAAMFEKTISLTNDEFDRLVDRLATSSPGLVKVSELGRTAKGTPIRLLTVTDFATGDERKKIGYYIQGHIHVKEMSGTPTALYLASRLAETHRPGGILEKTVFYIVPRCVPDGADLMARTPGNLRSGWGALMPDASMVEPKDIDGDGRITKMRIECPDGDLVVSPVDSRCMVSRKLFPHLPPPYFKYYEEGVFHNWNGKLPTLPWPRTYWREYLDYNRNWEPGWKREIAGAGEAPLNVPETRLQADFILAHRNIRAAIALHNGYGIVFVHRVEEKDKAKYLADANRLSALTGFPVLKEWIDHKQTGVADVKTSGRFTDFCYRKAGFTCITMELGTRETSCGLDAREMFVRNDPYTAPYEVIAMEDAHPELPKSWLPWKKVKHPQLGEVEVGGLCDTVFASPLPKDLEKTSERLFEFVVSHAADLVTDEALAEGRRWQLLPIDGGGYVQNVVIAPSNPNVWYSYVDVGGPYRSDDAGGHWRPLHGNMPMAMRELAADHVRTLDVDPRDADRFVIAAGDRFDRPAGVYVSRDGGRTFRRTLKARFYGDGPLRSAGKVIARDPNDPDVLLCGADFDGIFRSEDGGETWKKAGLERNWITCIMFDAAVKCRAYACAPDAAEARKRRGAEVAAQTLKGFYRSDDGGRTWRKVAEDSPLEMCQARGDGRLVAIFGGEAHSVRVSSDGGETWADFGQGLPGETRTATGLKEGHFLSLAAGPDFWLVGDAVGNVWRRRLDEAAWTRTPNETMASADPVREGRIKYWIAHRQKADMASLTVDGRNPDHWLATDWFTIWETFDAGRNWKTRIRGMMQLVPFTVACDPNDSRNIYCGIADMGMSVSQDNGRTYSPIMNVLGANQIAFFPNHPGKAIATGGKMPKIDLVVSPNSGKWWRPSRKAGLPDLTGGAHGAYTVAVDPSTDYAYLTVSGPVGKGSGGIYRSRDFGDTWEWFGEGLPAGSDIFKDKEFNYGYWAGWPPEIVFAPDGSAVCTASKTGQMYFLDKEAGAWCPIDGTTNGHNIMRIAADPFAKGRFVMAGDPLKESLDGGRTWGAVAGGDGTGGVSVAFDAHNEGLAVACGKKGLFVSYDGGRKFEELEGGLDLPTGIRLLVFVDRKRLFFVTRGSGIFTRLLP